MMKSGSLRYLYLGRKIDHFQKALFFILVTCALSMLYFASNVGNKTSKTDGAIQQRNSPDPSLKVDYYCECVNRSKSEAQRPSSYFSKVSNNGHKTEKKMLLLVETYYSSLGKQIRSVMDALKFPYRVEVLRKSLPPLTTASLKGKFSIIVFENYYKYLNMDSWNRELFDKYCKEYSVGVVGFLLSRADRDYERAKVIGFPLEIYQKQKVYKLELNVNSSLFYITRPGSSIAHFPLTPDWLLFSGYHKTFESVLYGYSNSTTKQAHKGKSVVLLDNGEFDGISRLLLGFDFRFWLMKLLFVDGLHFLSGSKFTVPLLRFLQIDIDDIFVGPTDFRMTRDDVNALILAQERLKKVVPGFAFHLGYSGKYFQNGNALEDEGDALLIEKSSNFYWFPHMWRHNHAQHCNGSQLEEVMLHNRQFAQKYNLPIRYGYAVAPHHAGVYPVHESLYAAWKKVWDVRVTSTEEYPHHKPAFLRRGFVYREISVLPRQTCGLYTHTVFMDNYPGGKEKLDENLLGGDMFFTFVFNPFLIFMTHWTNYANDRLALYTFETAVRFVRCWTNFELKSIDPLKMAEKYFAAYPEEILPIWGNPCLDKKHFAIWSGEKRCDRFPRALILGPQKTGTTALYTFLKMHPGVQTSVQSSKTFEEVQFFSGKNYKNGLDWYMSFFEVPHESWSTKTPFFFEKSAAYFDAELAPRRVKALIPDARLIVILISPGKRAYSWYQHMRAHEDYTALAYSFREVLEARKGNGDLWKLRQHCLVPGMYSHHIERWLDYFAHKQLLLLDGEVLKKHPVEVMEVVQKFLGLDPVLEYNALLKFDPEKGFFCQVLTTASNQTKTKCLGRGKGRTYPPIDPQDEKWLLKFYRPYNIALHRLLKKYAYGVPSWLQKDLESAV